MKTSEGGLRKVAARIGTLMFTAWTLILGPVGLVFLLALVYAMAFSNMALGIVALLVLFSPLLLTALWAPVMGAALIVERWSVSPALEPEPDSL